MKPKDVNIDRVLEALGGSLERWHHQCHAASLAIVKAHIFPVARVARGVCVGVGGQHSWVVLGDDCYDPKATIVDPTLWSYDSGVTGVWVGTGKFGPDGRARHQPFGGYDTTIWQWGRPSPPVGPVVSLTPQMPLSRDAQDFLDVLGPLDRAGWRMLTHAPPGGWPMGEILRAMVDTGMGVYVPIDKLGMLTDLNPGGLYLAGEANRYEVSEES